MNRADHDGATMTEEPTSTTCIKRGTEIRGSLKADTPVLVEGYFEGQLEAPELTIAEGAKVRGTVRAGRMRCSGTIAGSLDAHDLALSGRVLPDTIIRADSLLVQAPPLGAPHELILGECLIEAGPDPYERRTQLADQEPAAPSLAPREVLRALPAATREVAVDAATPAQVDEAVSENGPIAPSREQAVSDPVAQAEPLDHDPASPR